MPAAVLDELLRDSDLAKALLLGRPGEIGWQGPFADCCVPVDAAADHGRGLEGTASGT